MALIDFPNVPISPGVPTLRRAVSGVAVRTGVLGRLQAFDQFGLLDDLLSRVWGVYTNDFQVALAADSVVSFKYRGEEKIASHPTENGGFASYNKVAMPYDIQMTITCSGNGRQSRDQILSKLEELKASTDTYVIVTPDYSYTGANMITYDYTRTAKNGVSLLQVALYFQEVRQTATSIIAPVAQASGAANVSVGTVKPLDPSKPELAIFNDSVFR